MYGWFGGGCTTMVIPDAYPVLLQWKKVNNFKKQKSQNNSKYPAQTPDQWSIL